MDGFFAKYRSVMPYLDERRAGARAERRQSPEDRARYDDTTKCILCAACTTSCPSFWAQPAYVGPAAIVQGAPLHLRHARRAAEERLEILADKDGVWRCRTIFNCTDACPRGINITRAILEVSSAIVDAATGLTRPPGPGRRRVPSRRRTPRHPHRRRRPRQPRSRVARARCSSTDRVPGALDPARPPDRDDLRAPRRARRTTSPSGPAWSGRSSWRASSAPSGWTCSSTRS